MRLLDLFCGAGGSAVGYANAGFEIIGVDIEPQKNYPFQFIKDDARKVLAGLSSKLRLREFDAIHASPPCQAFTQAQTIRGREHPDLLTPTRELLLQTDKPWIIENVKGAPMRPDIFLCGTMFGLGIPKRGYLARHRLFEIDGWAWRGPYRECTHPKGLRSVGVYGHTGRKSTGNKSGNHGWLLDDWKEAMGIDWMKRKELSQAIPPAYTEYIGGYLMKELVN